MPDNPRIEELRRRVQKDPASIAFAQLAEEYRRAGEFEEAIRVCQAGLEQHPSYLSARVTLGRALLETGSYEQAQVELEEVIRNAPDNLAAIRALADIHQRRDDSAGGTTPTEQASEPPSDPVELPHADLDVAFGNSDDQFARALASLGAISGDVPTDDHPPVIAPAAREDPALAELEGWLVAIAADRAARTNQQGA